MFDVGFRPQFMPLPLRRPGLGQEDSPFITSYDQGPPAESYPGMYTSYDQGPPAEPVPDLVTQQDLQKSLEIPATDWGKVLQDVVKAGASGYAGYTKAQIAEAAAKQKAGFPPGLTLPGGKMPPSSGLSPNVVFLVGGIAVAAIIAVIAAT